MTQKQFTPTKEMIKAAETVFLAMAYTASIKPAIQAIQRKVLEENKYQYDAGFKDEYTGIITSIEHDYLMSRADMKDYCNKLHEAYLKAGFEVEKDYCPLLIAEHAERDAKRELIDALAPITGIQAEVAVRHYKQYNELIELSLKLMAPYCSSTKILNSLKAA